ncbi:hypothetical protein [Tropicimonas aquimaris]|uniref:Glycosyltransferase RgtA/B/C/D-like domain-containing protein n=1 Tax=Tropicimonas aquimaris TaxID=914152 RepID=A0ABW3IRU4_9RHOB
MLNDNVVERTFLVPAFLLLATAVFVRLYPFAGAFFPLNDGALFLAFVEHIHAGAYFTEPCVGYNGECVPFAYPPLSFFAASGLLWLGLAPVQVAVVYPLALSLLVVLAALWLYREVIEDDFIFLLAGAAALLQVRSIEYLLMGGGISRSTGALFFLLTLIAALAATSGNRTRPAVLGGLFAGLALLAHLEWGINAIVGAVLLVLFSSRTGAEKARVIVLAGLCAALVVAPWAIWQLSTQGLDPFRSASSSAHWSLPIAVTASAQLSFFRPFHLTWLCVIGSVVLWQRRENVWLAMLVAFYFVTPRHFGSVAVFPTAILLAYGFDSVLNWLRRQLEELPGRVTRPAQGLSMRAEALAVVVVVALLTVSLVQQSGNVVGFRKLSPDVQAAASWAAEEFPDSAVAAILTDDPWAVSKDAEWWPYLSEHKVLNTVQGSEWLNEGEYMARWQTSEDLRVAEDCPSVRDVLERLGPPDYVIDVSSRNCVSEFGRPIFDLPGVQLFTFDHSG